MIKQISRPVLHTKLNNSRDIPSCLDYWFDVFHYKKKDYLAIYSTSFEIYEIKETPLELQAELINEFLIVPGCRVTVKAENNIVAIRYYCHPVCTGSRDLRTATFDLVRGSLTGSE